MSTNNEPRLIQSEVWDGAPTIEDVLDYCLRMRPDEAASRGDSALCVTPLITRMSIDGKVVELDLVDGRWVGHVVRVSGARQRSSIAKAMRKQSKASKRSKDEGYSEPEQVLRGIRWCLERKLAYKIYNDSGITGEYPNNDQALIDKLIRKKAARYRRIFETVLLDEPSLARRSPDDIASMRAYLEARCDTIMRAGITQDEAYSATEDEKQVRYRKQARRRTRAYFRQAFTQLWQDIEGRFTSGTSRVHLVTTCEPSRLCRDADLHIAFLQLMSDKQTEIKGLVEELLALRIDQPLNKGIAYLVASYHASRLEDISLSSFRGKIQRLESGRHPGKRPWWIGITNDGNLYLQEEYTRIVKKILDLYLSGHGMRSIDVRLRADGDTVEGNFLTLQQISQALNSDRLEGVIRSYGLTWKVLPAVVDDKDLLTEIRTNRRDRKSTMSDKALEPRFWSEHLLTGLLKCGCGKAMLYQGSMRDYTWNHPNGWYRCDVRHSTDKNVHANFDAKKLEDFIWNLVAKNTDVLRNALNQAVSGSKESMQSRRALLEEALERDEREYACKEMKARLDAEMAEEAAGRKPGTEIFERIVALLVDEAMAPARQALNDRRAEIARLRIECNKANRNDKVMDALSSMEDWDSLGTAAKNRLLRSIFKHITVYSRMRENRIEITLHSADAPLAPVYPRHANRDSYYLPTIAEWLDDSYGPAPYVQEPLPPPAKQLRRLNSYKKELAHIDGASELWAFFKANKIDAGGTALKWYRKRLEQYGANETLFGVLANVYRAYIELEQRRLSHGNDLPDKEA